MRCSRSVWFVVLLLALPAAALGEWAIDPTVNNPVCTMAGSQEVPQVLADGEGGSFLVWTDGRSGEYRLYAQRLDADGSPLWTAGGIRVCTFESEQVFFEITTDMAGGVIVVWQDVTETAVGVYGQRIGPDGTLLWLPGGQTVCATIGDQTDPNIDSDGQGGVVVGWVDTRDDSGDIYAQRLDSDGAQLWPASGVAVCTATGTQRYVDILSDSNGGATLVWNDGRGDDATVYARRVNYLGTPIWNSDGNRVAETTNYTYDPTIHPDGSQGYLICFVDRNYSLTGYAPKVQRLNAAGAVLWNSGGIRVGEYEVSAANRLRAVSDPDNGLYLAWSSETGEPNDIWVQRVTLDGAPVWGKYGRAVCDAEDYQYAPLVVLDEQGGVIMVWQDSRNSATYDQDSLYAQRLDAYGNKLWNENGNLIQLGSTLGYASACPDGRGGLIAAWMDTRDTGWDLYAQRIDDTGYLGDPDPRLEAIVDMPNDQGGLVNVHWTAGYLDAMPWHAVDSYSMWMRQPAAKSAAPLAADELATLSGRLGCAPELLTALATAGWTFVEQVPAMLESEYGCLAPTYGDSTLTDPNPTEYRVVAHGADPWLTWESLPMLGYSMDNLAPEPPLNLNGEWTSFTEVTLNWSPGVDEDLARYRVYRSTDSGFEPTDDDLLGSPIATTFADYAPGGSWYYRVAAVDVHGNEGPAGDELCMTSAAAVGDAVPNPFALYANYPNPFNPSTNIRFDLPEALSVDLAVFSVAGARVATLRSGVLSAGRHDLTWRGTDDAGRAQPSGVYFLRLDAGRFSQTRTMVLLR